MEPLKAELLFSIPLSEDKMHANTPLRWKVGGLTFETNLFTYHKLEVFNALASMVKLYEANGKPHYTLLQFLTIITGVSTESDDEIKQTTRQVILDGLEDAKQEYGYLPDSVIELIAAVTEANDLDESYQGYCAWHDDNKDLGLLPTMEDWRRSESTRRQYFVNFLKYNLDIESCLSLLESMQKANVVIKKKHLGIKIEEVADDLRQYKNRRRGFFWKKES